MTKRELEEWRQEACLHPSRMPSAEHYAMRVRQLIEMLDDLLPYEELRLSGISVGYAQQRIHMAKAACEALGLDEENTSPNDIRLAVQRACRPPPFSTMKQCDGEAV